VACDAELQEKNLADLKRLGEMLKDRCGKIMAEWTTLKENDTTEDPGMIKICTPFEVVINMNYLTGQKKRERGPSFKLGGVSVNAKTLIATEKELEPLDEILPSDNAERGRWVLDARLVCLKPI
jgi:chromodomain-helicase-DNA-binding protein 1